MSPTALLRKVRDRWFLSPRSDSRVSVCGSAAVAARLLYIQQVSIAVAVDDFKFAAL